LPSGSAALTHAAAAALQFGRHAVRGLNAIGRVDRGVQFGTAASRRCETVGPRLGHPRCLAAVPRGGCAAFRRASAVGIRRVTYSAPRPVGHADGRSPGLSDSPRVTPVQQAPRLPSNTRATTTSPRAAGRAYS